MWVLKADNLAGELLLAIAAGRSQLHNSRRSDCETMRQWVKSNRLYNQAYYQSLMLWYIMKHYPLAMTPDFKSSVPLPELKALSTDDERQKYIENTASTAMVSFLLH